MIRWQDVYEFWFGDTDLQNAAAVAQRMKIWFGKDEAFDRQIQSRFAPVLAQSRHLLPWAAEDRGLLSLVILHDQFPRNAFRGTAGAFAFDSQALALSRQAVAAGLHKRVLIPEAIFLLLPFEHAEHLGDQQLSLQLYSELHARAPESFKGLTAGTLDYARRHHEVIDRFGRFPHRNSILGRESTAEELEFLRQPGSSF